VCSRRVIGDQDIVMGSSQKYWQYARDCARWAGQTKQADDRDIFQRMAKAWVHLALVDEDVVREVFYEPPGRLHS
jgi:hypothetical protein